MRIEIKTIDGMLVDGKDGSVQDSQVLNIRHQARPNGRWTEKNIIVTGMSVSSALRAAAAALEAK